MKTGSKGIATLLIALLILAVAWAVFLYHQNQEHLKESNAAGYILSALAVTAVLLAATGLGSLISGAGNRAGGCLTSCALGLAVLGLGVLGIAAAGLLSPAAVWILIALAGALSFRHIAALLRQARGWLPEDRPGYMAVGFLLIIAAGLCICLVSCLAPLTANDSLVYHLNIPRIYVLEGGLERLPHNVYANMPHNGEILYTLACTVSGETGARLLYFTILLLAGATVFSLARRLTGTLPALIGAACFLVHPLILDHRVVGNVDVLLAYFYVAAVLLALDIPGGRPGLRSFVLLGILGGFMLGIKYTALFPCLTVIIVLVWAGRPRPGLRQIGVAALVAALVFAPWLVKNALHVGNPVYPVMESVFDGANWDEVQSGQLTSWQRSMGMGRSVGDYLLLPLNVSLRGKPGLNYTRFDGTIVPVFLILLPFAFFRRKRLTTLLLVMAAAGFVFWAVTSQQLRFLIPTLAIASAVAAAGASNIAGWTGRRLAAPFLILLMLVMISGLVLPDQYGRPFIAGSIGERLPAVTGVETRQAHLERNVQSYSMFEYLNASLPAGTPIFMIWENRGYYLDRPYFADSFFEASSVMRMVAQAGDPGALARRIAAMGFSHVVVNEYLGRYFSQRYSPRDRALLDAFMSEHLEAIHSVNGLTLYRLREERQGN